MVSDSAPVAGSMAISLPVGEAGHAVMIVCGGKTAISDTANNMMLMTVPNRMTEVPCVAVAMGIGCVAIFHFAKCIVCAGIAAAIMAMRKSRYREKHGDK